MITILDFEKGDVHTYHVGTNFNWNNVEDFIDEHGHNLNNCEYMTSRADQEPIHFYTH